MQLSMVWKQITLQQWPTVGWQQSSYINALTTRLQHWSAASWVFSRGRAIATVLVALVFAAAPFVSTTLIGLLLLVCAGIWTLLVFTDSDRPPLTPVHLMVLSYWSITTIATGFSPVRTAAVDGWVKLSLYLMLFALLVRLLRSPRIRSILIGVYLHIALIVSAAGLRQWFFGADALATWVDPESSLAGTTRVYSYLGNPNLLAGYLIPATFLSVAAFFVWGDSLAKIRQQSATWLTPVAQLKESQPKLWSILWAIAFGLRLFITPKGVALTMAIVHSTCLVVTFSRGGWLGFLAGGFVFLLLIIHWIGPHLPKFWRRWSLPLVLGGSTG
ncbi:MAG: hypothetical protein VKJ64_07995, partial [Leptolyngbyaceae bacterium]|nr:hypothetical protein [Leptolyngbyaceae bacterium]